MLDDLISGILQAPAAKAWFSISAHGDDGYPESAGVYVLPPYAGEDVHAARVHPIRKGVHAVPAGSV